MLCIMVGSVPMLILFAGRNQLSGKIHYHVMTRKRFIYHRPGLIWGESTHNGQGCGGLIFPCCRPEQVVDYNKVSVTVAMVISTMHEKSCIDSHNAREFEKSPQIQSFTLIKLRKHHTYEFIKLFQPYDPIIQKVITYRIEQNLFLNYH